MNGKAEIYGLFDPRTEALRYIGKAVDSQKRLKSHARDSVRRNTPVYLWMRELRSAGLLPVMKVLEVSDDWREAERRLIAVSRARGEILLNVAAGGDEPHCPADVRAENGRKNAKSVHSDASRKRLWSIKKAISSGISEGYGSNELRNKLRRLAVNRPELFGLWANLPDRIENDCAI